MMARASDLRTFTGVRLSPTKFRLGGAGLFSHICPLVPSIADWPHDPSRRSQRHRRPRQGQGEAMPLGF